MPDELLKSMREYLQTQGPYLDSEVVKLKSAGNFQYDLSDGDTAKINVFEARLKSGRRIFAAEGGIKWKSFGNRFNPVKNVYMQEIPDAETASKVHIYSVLAKILSDSAMGQSFLNMVAKTLELPEQFQRVD